MADLARSLLSEELDMRLIVVPGLSSPNRPDHAPAFDLIRREARRAGWDAEILVLPGQMGAPWEGGGLSLSSACGYLAGRLLQAEGTEGPWRVMGTSFGCTALLKALLEVDAPQGLERVLLWGPIPFWSSWRCFRGGVGRGNVGKSTTIADDAVFMEELEPVEHLLLELRRRSTVPVVIGAGTIDRYCTPSYQQYLRSWAAEQTDPTLDNLSFTSLAQCAHNVVDDSTSPGWRAYIEFVLGRIPTKA